MFIEEIDTTTVEGKLLSVALARLGYLYKDKSKVEILRELEKVVREIQYN